MMQDADDYSICILYMFALLSIIFNAEMRAHSDNKEFKDVRTEEVKKIDRNILENLKDVNSGYYKEDSVDVESLTKNVMTRFEHMLKEDGFSEVKAHGDRKCTDGKGNVLDVKGCNTIFWLEKFINPKNLKLIFGTPTMKKDEQCDDDKERCALTTLTTKTKLILPVVKKDQNNHGGKIFQLVKSSGDIHEKSPDKPDAPDYAYNNEQMIAKYGNNVVNDIKTTEISLGELIRKMYHNMGPWFPDILEIESIRKNMEGGKRNKRRTRKKRRKSRKKSRKIKRKTKGKRRKGRKRKTRKSRK